MKLPRWQRGRQVGGYDKLLLAQSQRWKWDCYLLRYRVHCYIPQHVDLVDPKYEHHRLNIVLRKPLGGRFFLDGMYRPGRVHRFRPDMQAHEVTPILRGTRYVLSIGWLKEKT